MVLYLFQGLKAVHSPHTGIIDYGVVTQSYGDFFKARGGKVFTDFSVSDFRLVPEGKPGDPEGNKYPMTVVGDPKKVCKSLAMFL